MKRTSGATLAAIFSIVLALSASWASATIVVPTDQPTIQAAINAALTGEDIIVLAGTYPEGQINVTTPVQIYGPNTSVGPGQARFPEAHVIGGFAVRTDNTIIQGFEIEGGIPQAGSSSWTSCIYGPQALHGIDISFNRMHSPSGTASTAIELGDYNGARSSNLTIGSNTIDGQLPGSSIGVFLYAVDNASVIGNRVVLTTITNFNGEYGLAAIILDGAHDAIVAKNDLDCGQTTANISSGAYAIGVQAGTSDIQNVNISNNRTRNCIVGVLSSSLTFAVRNLSIARNDIETTMFGISLQGHNVGANTVSHDLVSINLNHIAAGQRCVLVIGAPGTTRSVSNVTLRRNCFAPLSGAVGVSGVSVSASLNIPTNGGVIDARMNYWDSPSGPSAVGPGTGLGVSNRVDFARWLEACP
jgi:hypothetical protein